MYRVECKYNMPIDRYRAIEKRYTVMIPKRNYFINGSLLYWKINEFEYRNIAISEIVSVTEV